jgi:hypothetical protein
VFSQQITVSIVQLELKSGDGQQHLIIREVFPATGIKAFRQQTVASTYSLAT